MAKDLRLSLSCGYTRRPVGLTDRCMVEVRMFYRKYSRRFTVYRWNRSHFNFLSLRLQHVSECKLITQLRMFSDVIECSRVFCFEALDGYHTIFLKCSGLQLAIHCTWRSVKICVYLNAYPKPLSRQEFGGGIASVGTKCIGICVSILHIPLTLSR